MTRNNLEEARLIILEAENPENFSVAEFLKFCNTEEAASMLMDMSGDKRLPKYLFVEHSAVLWGVAHTRHLFQRNGEWAYDVDVWVTNDRECANMLWRRWMWTPFVHGHMLNLSDWEGVTKHLDALWFANQDNPATIGFLLDMYTTSRSTHRVTPRLGFPKGNIMALYHWGYEHFAIPRTERSPRDGSHYTPDEVCAIFLEVCERMERNIAEEALMMLRSSEARIEAHMEARSSSRRSSPEDDFVKPMWSKCLNYMVEWLGLQQMTAPEGGQELGKKLLSIRDLLGIQEDEQDIIIRRMMAWMESNSGRFLNSFFGTSPAPEPAPHKGVEATDDAGVGGGGWADTPF